MSENKKNPWKDLTVTDIILMPIQVPASMIGVGFLGIMNVACAVLLNIINSIGAIFTGNKPKIHELQFSKWDDTPSNFEVRPVQSELLKRGLFEQEERNRRENNAKEIGR